MSSFPEHEKLRKISDKSQIIGEFLEWVSYKHGYELYGRNSRGQLVPSRMGVVELLAEFFEIDLEKIDEEKQEMLKLIGCCDE